MYSYNEIQAIADKQDWNYESIISILCGFIDEIDRVEDLKKYAEKAAYQENNLI